MKWLFKRYICLIRRYLEIILRQFSWTSQCLFSKLLRCLPIKENDFLFHSFLRAISQILSWFYWSFVLGLFVTLFQWINTDDYLTRSRDMVTFSSENNKLVEIIRYVSKPATVSLNEVVTWQRQSTTTRIIHETDEERERERRFLRAFV